MHADTALEARNLACVRGGRILFEGLSFRAGAGETLTVEGANGAGKTSLLRLVAGLLAPAAGTIRFTHAGGAADAGEERGLHIAWLGHQNGLKPQLTVGENLSFHARLHGGGDIGEALGFFALAALRDAPVRILSAGQRRRAALARLTLSRRPIWLLDEPFAALDEAGKDAVRAALARHAGAGGIAIVATHEAPGFAGARLTLGKT